MTRLFIDTEFTSLQAPELISVALVGEDGREFYAERSDFPLAGCTTFVIEAVLPLLGPPGERQPCTRIRLALREWLDPYADGEALVCCDDHRDWTLFCELLGEPLPAWVRVERIANRLDERTLHAYFARPGVRRHHALDDARGNRAAFDVA